MHAHRAEPCSHAPAACAQVKSGAGNLPLHYAAQYQATEVVVRALLEANHEGAQVKDVAGNYPIHLAGMYQCIDGVMDALIEAFPDGASAAKKDGNLPLHFAAGNQATVGVTKALLVAFPDGAYATEETGMRPLQLANTKQKVLIRVLKEKETDKKAIDLVVEKNEKVDMVAAKPEFKAKKKADAELQEEKKAIVDGAKKQLDDNNDVIQAILIATFGTPQLLLDTYGVPLPPDGPVLGEVKRAPYKDFLDALKRSAPEEALIDIFTVDPSIAFEKDKWGKLPLHVACEFAAPPVIVRMLINAYPEAAKMKTSDNRYAPFCAKAAPVAVSPLPSPSLSPSLAVPL